MNQRQKYKNCVGRLHKMVSLNRMSWPYLNALQAFHNTVVKSTMSYWTIELNYWKQKFSSLPKVWPFAKLCQWVTDHGNYLPDRGFQMCLMKVICTGVGAKKDDRRRGNEIDTDKKNVSIFSTFMDYEILRWEEVVDLFHI